MTATPAELTRLSGYDHNTPRQVTGSRRHSASLKSPGAATQPCAFCIIHKLRGPQRSREDRQHRPPGRGASSRRRAPARSTSSKMRP